MSKTVTIIDTFGFFFRSFYALPQHLKNKDGFPTGLLTGFTNFISTLQKDHDSDYIIFAIDTKGDTFRNEIDANYKANRQSPPEELKMQLPIAISWIDKMGYKTLGKEGFEADDMIATVSYLAKQKGYKVRVVSHDKDLYQLIEDDSVVVIDAIKKKSMNEESCFEKYGVTPAQFIDYQSILGDTADNFTGVLYETGKKTPTSSPTASLKTAVPTPTLRLPTKTPTPTLTPTAPPLPPTPTPKSIYALKPTATPTPAPQYSIDLIAPGEGIAGNRIQFQWQDAALPTDFAYELVIGKTQPALDLMVYGMSPSGMTDDTSIDTRVSNLEGKFPDLRSGQDYYWGVCIVQKEPYKRLWCTNGRGFRYDSSDRGGSSGGSKIDE